MSWLDEFAAGYVEAAQWSSTGSKGCGCANPKRVTCGDCERSWCEACDPAPSALCHFCEGIGTSDAELIDDVPLDSVELGAGVADAMKTRLLAWWDGFAPLLNRAAMLRDGDGSGRWAGWELLGHDVWLSQVGHGTGAWDRKSLEVCLVCSGDTAARTCACYNGTTMGEAVTDAAKLLGESAYGYIGDDGLAYFDGFAS